MRFPELQLAAMMLKKINKNTKLIDNLLHRFGFSKLNYFEAKKVSRQEEIANFHMNTRKPVVLVAPWTGDLVIQYGVFRSLRELVELKLRGTSGL